mmetsp:Transcript_33804/g.79152  ORF Transcript_33804/g.79152 Transcript_33804/m.79152 type:complete len:205 (+) Transcript_33804:156-770(+)
MRAIQRRSPLPVLDFASHKIPTPEDIDILVVPRVNIAGLDRAEAIPNLAVSSFDQGASIVATPAGAPSEVGSFRGAEPPIASKDALDVMVWCCVDFQPKSIVVNVDNTLHNKRPALFVAILRTQLGKVVEISNVDDGMDRRKVLLLWCVRSSPVRVLVLSVEVVHCGGYCWEQYNGGRVKREQRHGGDPRQGRDGEHCEASPHC